MGELVMLKLGGSLITDKDRAYTARADVIADIAKQLRRALLRDRPAHVFGLVLGHGSGSFGHAAASLHRTQAGAHGLVGDELDAYWNGYAEVHLRAAQLNSMVMAALHDAAIPSIAFAPSSTVVLKDRAVAGWDLAPLRAAIAAGLVPVVYGDAVLDEVRGGGIISTEQLFVHLAHALGPVRILLAGLEPGVWVDFPKRSELHDELTPGHEIRRQGGLTGSASPDVTGGMHSKVGLMLELVGQVPGLTVQIFSGTGPNAIERALRGERLGTILRAK
jgi:isopentenyl phosphate kinase